MRMHGLCCRSVSDVCLSVTFVYCIQTADDIVKHLCRNGSSEILVFLTPSTDTQFQGNPFSRALNTWGEKIFRFSTEIAVYIDNGAR